MRFNSLVAAASFAALSSHSVSAGAEDGASFALNRLDPAPAGDAFFAVPSASVEGRLSFRAMGFIDYANRPLDVTALNTGKEVASVVAHQATLHGNVTVALFDRVALNLDVPAVIQSGEAFASGGSALPAPATTGTGNIRVGGRGKLWGDARGLVHVGLGGYLFLPTTGDYASDPRVRGWVHALASGEAKKRVRYALAVGPEFREDRELLNVSQGSRLSYSAAAAALLGPNRELQLGPEVVGTVPFGGIDARTVSLDVLVGAKYRFLEDFTVGAGAGTALSAGVGSPRARAMLSLSWAPAIEVAKRVNDADADGDTIPDNEDACPENAGVASTEAKANGCPPAQDKDGDGVADPLDACVDQAGVASPDPKANGCPRSGDKDGDGIADGIDACPDKAGVASADAKTHGCPLLDTDGDGVTDASDACVDKSGVASADAKTNGCPAASDGDGDGVLDDVDACPAQAGLASANPALRGCPISTALDKTAAGLEFEVGKAVLRPTSEAVVDALATMLKEHPELTKLEVQSHTDNQGAKRINKTISQDRAAAVVAALAKRGVAGARLVAKGYGDEQPLVANDTPEGQQKNRRVAFVVLEKK